MNYFFFNKYKNLLIFRELNEALTIAGIDPKQDMAILSQIKTEVRKLNTKENIWNKITHLEKELEFEFNKQRFIYTAKSDDEDSCSSSRSNKKQAKVRISSEVS